MSGGIAYVYDEAGDFATRVNMEMVELEDLSDGEDEQRLRELIQNHVGYTDSDRGKEILENWDQTKGKFVKIMPIDYKRALAELKREQEAADADESLQEVTRG